MEKRTLEAIIGYLLMRRNKISFDDIWHVQLELSKKCNKFVLIEFDHAEIADIVFGNSDMYCFKTELSHTFVSRSPNSESWFSKKYLDACYRDCFSGCSREVIHFLEKCGDEK